MICKSKKNAHKAFYQEIVRDLGIFPCLTIARDYDYKFNIGDMAFIPRFMARVNFKRDSAVGVVINRYFIKPVLEPYYVVEVEGQKFEIGEELLCRNTFVQNADRS